MNRIVRIASESVHKTAVHRLNSNTCSLRKGLAQIELTLFLPLYVSILMILLTLGSLARSRQQVIVGARHEAWMRQAEFGDATEQTIVRSSHQNTIGRVLLGLQDPAGGLIKAGNSTRASVYLKALDVAVDTRSEHYLLTDPWDYRVLKFEDEHRHSRLTLGERATFLGNIDRGAFTALVSNAGMDAREASRQIAAITHQRQNARQQISEAVKEVNQSINSTKHKVQQMQKELQLVQNQQPNDNRLVDAIQRELRSAEQELRTLQDYLQQLQSIASEHNVVL